MIQLSVQMLKMLNKTLRAGAVLSLIWAHVAQAADKNYLFDVQLLGLKAGELKFSVRTEGNQYSAAGKLYPTGLAATMTTFFYDVTVSGTIQNGRYMPRIYSEDSDTGKRQEEKQITYSGSKIRVKSPKLPKPHWLNPNKQQGKVDPMTAIFLIFEDQPKDALCSQDVHIFDGARSVRMVLKGPRKSGNAYICDGTYIRTGGYSESELRDGTRFPFTMTYSDAGDVYRTERFDVKSVRGRAAFIRR